MSPPSVQKIPYEEFVRSCAHFLSMPSLEEEMKQRVENILREVIDFTSGGDAQSSLQSFLQQQQDFLGIVLNMAGLPQEKFLRILSAERFAKGDYENEWGIQRVQAKIKKDGAFAAHVAKLLLEGRSNKLLSRKVADFYLQQLSLSDTWSAFLQDEDYIARIVRKKLTGEYHNAKGMHFEQMINATLAEANIPCEKGQVALVQKEVDHAIPSLKEARIMIMSVYYETTSSGQTTRANEQRAMYSKIKERNERYPGKVPVIFINIVDGGGWLARRSDLKKMWASCDYCLNAGMLHQLPAIVKQHWRKKR